MSDYIPTTEEVRSYYQSGSYEDGTAFDKTGTDFDRWLAGVKAEQDKATTDRIIALLEANVGHSMDRYRYWSEVFELIKG